MTDSRRALVLFSGGQDSTVCLAWALARYAYVETIGFDHALRHAAELECRLHVRSQIQARFPAWHKRLGDDHLMDLTFLDQVAQTRPTPKRVASMKSGGLPNEFVAGRNLLYFALAATIADRRDLNVLVGGMGESELSSYPDSTDNALKALQVTLSLGLAKRMTIATPLMWRDKSGIWALAEELGGESFVDLIVEHTHSCYAGDRDQRHEWGYGCGMCPSCDLRRQGYQAWLVS